MRDDGDGSHDGHTAGAGAAATAAAEHQADDGYTDDGYADMAAAMLRAAAIQPGFLGVESAREAVGITVSYWADLASIAAWKRDADHLLAQQLGRERWYGAYKVRVCRVEREYAFSAEGLDQSGESEIR